MAQQEQTSTVRQRARPPYTGAFTSKVDAKGRLSVPAELRRVLGIREGEEAAGIYCFPSLGQGLLECGGGDLIEILGGIIDNEDHMGEERRVLEFEIFSATRFLPFDENGRIILPPDLREAAGLGSEARITGYGDRFWIMAPALAADMSGRARSISAQNAETYRSRGLPSLTRKRGDRS